MSLGITGNLLNGGLWRTSVNGFWQTDDQVGVDPSIPNLPLVNPIPGLVRGLAFAVGTSAVAATGLNSTPVASSGRIFLAVLRGRQKVREAVAATSGTSAVAAVGLPLYQGRAIAAGAGTALGVSQGVLRVAGAASGVAYVVANSDQLLALAPDADVSDGGWTTDAGLTTLFSAVNEATINDATFIRSASTPVNDTCRLSLSNPALAVGEEFVVEYRYAKSGTDRIDLVARLKEGTTTIASWTHTDIGTSEVTASQTLTAPQIASIIDPNALEIELVANKV